MKRRPGWSIYHNCKCPRCKRYHADAVRDAPLPRASDGFLPTIKQECNRCLEARAGKGALEAYLNWRRKVIP